MELPQMETCSRERCIIQRTAKCFWSADDNLVMGYGKECTDYDTTLHRVFKICRKEILKHNKDNVI